MSEQHIPKDREHIHVDQPGNVHYWAQQLKCEEEKLLEAVDHVGDAIDDVKRFLVWGTPQDGTSPSAPRYP